MHEQKVLKHLLEPFDAVRKDPLVTEIVVNECGRFGVERAGEWSWHDNSDLTYQRLDAIGVLASFALSGEFSQEYPLARARLPTSERLQACRYPATLPDVISLTIRKPSEKEMLLEDDDIDNMFAETNTRPIASARSNQQLADLLKARDWRGFFRTAVRARKSIGVCGPTGGGKTAFLRRLLAAIQDYDRIITIEDTPEFGLVGPKNRVSLFYSPENPRLQCDDCRRAALRMRPDRIIIQEVRGAEAMGFLQALGNGHSGMTSWHSNEGGEWEALAGMVRQSEAGRSIPPDDVERYIKQFIDIVVWAAKEDKEYKVPRVWLKGVTEDA